MQFFLVCLFLGFLLKAGRNRHPCRPGVHRYPSAPSLFQPGSVCWALAQFAASHMRGLEMPDSPSCGDNQLPLACGQSPPLTPGFICREQGESLGYLRWSGDNFPGLWVPIPEVKQKAQSEWSFACLQPQEVLLTGSFLRCFLIPFPTTLPFLALSKPTTAEALGSPMK